MSTPPIPHRFEIELVVEATPQQVWQAVATADGISSWMLPTALEPRVGGRVRFDMAPGEASHGIVTGFDEGRRIAYEEDWATLAGHAGADVTPLATEFLIEAQSGGTCVVRIVSSAYGTGGDWENEFWNSMVQGWAPMLDHLRTYLAHFSGEHAESQMGWVEVHGTLEEVSGRIRSALGLHDLTVGSSVDGAGIRGSIEQLGDQGFTVLVDSPFRGFVAVLLMAEPGATTTHAMAHAYAFEPTDIDWQAWTDAIARASDD